MGTVNRDRSFPMNWFRKLFALLFALALPGCATTLYAPDERFVTPAMWEVSDKDTTIYLFGTIHALTRDTAWFEGPIERAYAASDELVTELDTSDSQAVAQKIATQALLPESQNLRELMQPADRAQFEEMMISLDMPVDSLDRIEPWYASIVLTLQLVRKRGFEPDSGVDTSLSGQAEGKRRSALETVEQQIALFDTLPMDAQLVLLDETVEAASSAADTLQLMVDSWRRGEAAGRAVLMKKEVDDPGLYKRLLTERTANWALWFERRLAQPGTVFIAVGAGHLAGKGSVQDLLQKRGVRVRRVRK
jgi:uncharacterized protein YbaP (TraB family)